MKKWLLFFCLSFSTLLMGVNMSWDTYKKYVLHHQKSVPGWCCPEKAEKLMELIRETNPKVCVEVGVFGGSSVYPMASALSFQKSGGIIHAIDPWSNAECLKGYTPGDPNYEWWGKVNLEAIYQQFLIILNRHKVSAACNVMRMTSEAALTHFADESIDILHIDGNHFTDIAVSDAVMWLPKVKKGGYIWFDDANWPETREAVQFVKEHCFLDMERSIGHDCYLFHKN